MTVQRIIFIRPGETDWNRLGRWQGWVAAPLNDHGRAQANALARYIRHIGMSALYTSDLRRALQTAEILSGALGFAPIPDSRLRERNIGVWQGLTQREMQDWYAEDFQKLRDDPHNYGMEGGESRAEVLKRITAAFNHILKVAKGETVGILSHTTATKVLLADIIEGYHPYDSDIGNTSVTTIHRSDAGKGWSLVADNELMHLEGLASQAVAEIEEG